jgi:hypothetical protein
LAGLHSNQLGVFGKIHKTFTFKLYSVASLPQSVLETLPSLDIAPNWSHGLPYSANDPNPVAPPKVPISPVTRDGTVYSLRRRLLFHRFHYDPLSHSLECLKSLTSVSKKDALFFDSSGDFVAIEIVNFLFDVDKYVC